MAGTRQSCTVLFLVDGEISHDGISNGDLIGIAVHSIEPMRQSRTFK